MATPVSPAHIPFLPHSGIDQMLPEFFLIYFQPFQFVQYFHLFLDALLSLDLQLSVGLGVTE